MNILVYVKSRNSQRKKYNVDNFWSVYCFLFWATESSVSSLRHLECFTIFISSIVGVIEYTVIVCILSIVWTYVEILCLSIIVLCDCLRSV